MGEDSDKKRVEEIIDLFKGKAENIHVQDFNTQVKQNEGEVLSFGTPNLFRNFRKCSLVPRQNQGH